MLIKSQIKLIFQTWVGLILKEVGPNDNRPICFNNYKNVKGNVWTKRITKSFHIKGYAYIYIGG